MCADLEECWGGGETFLGGYADEQDFRDFASAERKTVVGKAS